MTEAPALTAANLQVDAEDAPGALVALLKRFPQITDYDEETAAFGVLLRAWMAARPGEAAELHLMAGQHTTCTFKRAGLPTDIFVDLLSAIIRRRSNTDYSGIGLNARAAKLLVPVTAKPSNGGFAAAQYYPVLLTDDMLYVGGHTVWQRA